jgi:hypothetical protein
MENHNITRITFLSLLGLCILPTTTSAQTPAPNGYTYDITVKSTDAKNKTTMGKMRVQTVGPKARMEYLESSSKEAKIGDYLLTTDAGVSSANVSVATKIIEWTGYAKSFKEINKEKALSGSDFKSAWVDSAPGEKTLTRSFNIVYKQLVFTQKIVVNENHRFTIAPADAVGPTFNALVTSVLMDISTYALKFPEVQKLGASGLVPAGFVTKATIDLKAKVGRGNEGALIEIETTTPVPATIDEKIFNLPEGFKIKK